MRVLLAIFLAALLLLAAPVAAKPNACKKYKINGQSYVNEITWKCMRGYKVTCSSTCKKHLKKVNLACFSALIKERMPQRLSGSIRFYKSCNK